MRFKLPSLRIVSSPALAWLLLGLAGVPARALENLPYTNNFDGDAVGPAWEDPDFVVYSSFSFAANTWNIVTNGIGGSGNGFTSVTTNSTSTIYNGATVQSFIPAPLPVSMTAQVRILTTNSTGVSYLGFAAFGSRPDVGIVGVQTLQGNVIWPYLQITGTAAGAIGWVNFLNGSGNNSGITISNQVGSNLPINTNDVYTLNLNGAYDAQTNLALIFSIKDNNKDVAVTNSELVSASRMTSSYAGSFFGFMDRDNTGNAGLLTVLHDNFSLTTSLATNYLVDASQTINSGGWALTFNDEFGGSALNTNKWNTTYMWSGNGARTLSGNSEMEIYWDNQFVETNGVLRIRGDKLDSVYYSATYHFASGLIDTYQKFAQQYGYFEMRAKLPHGNGLWPAFWFLDNTTIWPPEIDDLEILLSYEDQPHSGAIQSAGSYFGQFNTAFNSTTAYHVYSMEWDPLHLTFYLDGQQVCQTHVPTNAPAPMQLLANLAIGGTGTIAPDPTTVFPAYMDIDYIRVWTRTNAAAPIPYNVGYDIGAVGLAGNTVEATNGTAVIAGAGSGFVNGATNDAFQFAAQPMAGDVDYDYQLQVSSMSVAAGQAGVMIRQTLDPASPYSTVYLSQGACVLQSRTKFSAPAFDTAAVPALSSTNLWLRLYRRGNAITAYQSADGIAWNYVAAVTNDLSTVTMGSSVLVGAAVSSGSTGILNTVGITNLNVPAIQVIQTVADPSGVVLTGPWLVQNAAINGGTGGYYGSEYLSDNKVNKGSCTAQFIPNLPAAATYDVYTAWLAASHAASNTPVAINYQGGTAQFVVNQQHQGGQWVYVGTFPFAAGTGGSLTISNPTSTAGYGVLANAVRFVAGPATPPASPAALPAPTGLTLTAAPARNQIGLRWNAVPGAGSYTVKRAATSGGPYTTITAGLISSSPYFTDSNVLAGIQYYYVVTAVNTPWPTNPGGQESPASNEAGGMPGVVVDNADASGVTVTGAWTAATTSFGYYGANYLQDGNAAGGKSVRFTPSLTVAGNYDVFLRWTSDPNRASNAPVDIIYQGGTNTVLVNQQVSDGVWWVYLGTYYFNAGTGGSVLVRDDGASGYVVADAVQFVPDSQKPLQITPAFSGPGFAIQSFAGSQYQLQRSPALAPASWQSLGPAQTGTGGCLNFSDSSNHTNQFYRVQISP